jgi:hypothetical protein
MTDVDLHLQRAAAPRAVGRTLRSRSSLLGSAEAAVAAGFAVFPVRPRTKVPAVLDWENRATRDVEQIHRWWRQWDWGIGVAAGASGLLVIDLDPGRGQPPRSAGAAAAHGRDVLARLAVDRNRSLLEDAHTYTVATPSGGWHLYFRQPQQCCLRNSHGRLGRHIDTRGHGGYVLAAGSRGPGRTSYRVARVAPIAELPDWITTALTPSAPPQLVAEPVVVADVSAYVRAVVIGECDNVAAACEGRRHQTLLRAARRLGQWVGSGALSHHAAHTALTTAAQHFIGVSGYTARQVDRDITDGLGYGARRPRTIATTGAADRSG